jgi:radical SAM superfamily enzyme YgiQ (UPF0313 family)
LTGSTDGLEGFRVLFVYPNFMLTTHAPMSIPVLDKCLRQHGIETRLFDTTLYRTEATSYDQHKVDTLQMKEFSYGEDGPRLKASDLFEDLRRVAAEFRPNLLAITIVEPTFPLATRIVQSLRHLHIPTIAGGVFPTLNPEIVLGVDGIDMVCTGEGEQALVELCGHMSSGRDPAEIRNLILKRDGRIVVNGIRPPVNMDGLPFPDLDMFERCTLVRAKHGRTYLMVNVEVDRGCPYDCTYCSAPALRRVYRGAGYQYFRHKSVDQAIAEIRQLCERYRPDYINLCSENILLRDHQDLCELAERYSKEVALPFWCQTRPETVTEDKVALLREMGCDNIQVGLEHGNERLRNELLRRYCSNAQIVKAGKVIKSAGIRFTTNNIIGLPGETRELVFDTINLNREIGPDSSKVYMFSPYRGTELHRFCVEKGYIDNSAGFYRFTDGAELRNQPLSHQEYKGLQRTFNLYVRLPETLYGRIKVAERLDRDGDRMFKELRDTYYEVIFPDAGGPHGAEEVRSDSELLNRCIKA